VHTGIPDVEDRALHLSGTMTRSKRLQSLRRSPMADCSREHAHPDRLGFALFTDVAAKLLICLSLTIDFAKVEGSCQSGQQILRNSSRFEFML
jgi:hypothetical protein